MRVETPSLLITDDDVEFRQTLRSVFEPLGMRTLLAEDGEQALSIVRQEEVHLILLDMHMPKLTGLETIRRLKQFKAMVPCILMSAQLDELILQEAHQIQVFSVLSKPVTFRQLTGVVRQALERTYDWHWEEHPDLSSRQRDRDVDPPADPPSGQQPPRRWRLEDFFNR